MIEVTESAVNVCLNHLVFSDISTLYEYYNNVTAMLCEFGLPKPNRIYAGAEFCDKIFYHIRHTDFFNNLIRMSQYVAHISFVIPPIRESAMEYLKDILNIVENYSFIDELVFNDFGTMRYLHRQHPQYTLVAGRLIDKGMREARFNIYADSVSVQENCKMMESTNLNSKFYQGLFSEHGVNRIELDTLNGGMLHLSASENIKYTVHYPRIFLSRSDYCEFSGIGKKMADKFQIQGICTHMCSKVWERLCDPSENEIYKYGNAVFTTQKEKLSGCIDGTFRFVYSQGVENESSCSNSFV